MKSEDYLTEKRGFGVGLILFSVVGMIVFKQLDMSNTIFFLSFGWGLAMLI